MSDANASLLRRLLEQDQAGIGETLRVMQEIHVEAALCPEATLDAFGAFFRLLNAAAKSRSRDRELAGAVALICARHTKWGVTDLLRGRTTSVLGYCRMQAEAVALVHLFLDKPAKAQEWFDAKGGLAGKRFYQANQNALMAIMQQHPGLVDAYNRGSEQALHVRPSILARAYHTVETERADELTLHLLDNELRPDDPFVYLYTATLFFGAQTRVLHALWRGFPEIEQARFYELATLAHLATAFNDALAKKYPERFSAL